MRLRIREFIFDVRPSSVLLSAEMANNYSYILIDKTHVLIYSISRDGVLHRIVHERQVRYLADGMRKCLLPDV